MTLSAKCQFDDCDYTATVAGKAEWDEVWREHLEWHLREYFESEVAAGRMERIERPGESVRYREVLAEPTPKETT